MANFLDEIEQTRTGLTFNRLRNINRDRCTEWHADGSTDWSAADWGNALAGEVGELCNVIKKYRRIQTGVDNPDVDEQSVEVLLAQIRDELADVQCYLDLTADFFNIDLGDATIDKFNRVSEKRGYSQRL